MEFKELTFGKAAAENEAAEAPELLLEGYYDPYGVPNEVLSGNFTLILGPRGSGKSAITEHLRLKSLQDSQLFVSRLELKNVYFSQFSSLVPGGNGDQTHYPTAWGWVLLLSLFASFSRDEGAFTNSDEDYRRTLQALTAVGFLPKPRLQQLFQVSTTNKIMLMVPGVQVGNEEVSSQHGVQFYSAVDTLRQVAGNFHSDSKHIIVVDGLDDIFVHEDVQWSILTALMIEASRLNRFLREQGTPAAIIVLCRTDVFGRIPFPDINKIRQDWGTTLNWYPDSDRPQDSPLIALANKKASVHAPDLNDIVKQFFPRTYVLRSGKELSIHEYLLGLTRHRPRDYLRLLEYIRRAAPPTGRLDNHIIEVGAARYCIDNFVPEVRGELFGLLPRNDAYNALGILKAMGTHQFDLGQLEKKAKSDIRYRSIDLPPVVDQLFACGAIGNVVPGKREFYYDFSYRNPEVDFDSSRRLVLHNALIRGLNVPRRPADL